MGEYRQLILNNETQIEGCEAYKILLEKDDYVKRYIPNLRHQNDNYFQAQSSRKFNTSQKEIPSDRSEAISKIIKAVEEFNKKPEKKDLTKTAKHISNHLLQSEVPYAALGALIKKYLPEEDGGKVIKTISLLLDVAVFVARAYALQISTQPIFDGLNLIYEIFCWVKDDLCPFVDECGGWQKVLEKTWDFVEEHPLIVGGLVLGAGLAILGGLLFFSGNQEEDSNSKPNRRRNN